MTNSPQSSGNWTPENFHTDVPHSARPKEEIDRVWAYGGVAAI